MEKLTIQHIASFGIEGVQFISELDKPYDEYGKQPVWTCNGITYLFGEYCLNTKEGNDAYPISKCKLALRNISCLTKTIQHEGTEFIPIVELAKTAYPSSSRNFVLKGKYAIDTTSDLAFGFDDKDFESFDTNSAIIKPTFNQYQLFQKLAEWHIDFLGLIEKGLAIDKNTLK